MGAQMSVLDRALARSGEPWAECPRRHAHLRPPSLSSRYSLSFFDEAIADLRCGAGQGTEAAGLILFLVSLLADIDVGLPPAKHSIDQGGQLASGCKHGHAGSLVERNAAIVSAQGGGAFPHAHRRVAQSPPGARSFGLAGALFELLTATDGLPRRPS